MSIQFLGSASGMPVNDIIQQLIGIERRPIDLLMARKSKITTQQTQYTAVSSRITDLRSSITKLTDARLGSSMDLFQARTTTSSNANAVTATATNDAAIGTYNLDVTQLATATKATSTGTIGALTTSSTPLNQIANGTISSGQFTIYVNNQAQTITVNKDTDTMQTILTQIRTAIQTVKGPPNNVQANINNGAIEINPRGATISFGATGDTSNFAQITALSTGTYNSGTGLFNASNATTTINNNAAMTTASANLQTAVTAGTVTIGGKQFTIGATTTLNDFIATINSDPDAGVAAAYNSSTNKLELVSKKTGQQAITLGASGDTSNFLSAMKLVSGSDSLASQTLGVNAQFKINNGVTLTSTSNTVDSSITGLTGVTFNLLTTTGSTSANVTIKQDTDKLKTAVNDFITKFNAAISFIESQTKKDAVLNGENRVRDLRTQFRTTAANAVTSSALYDSLADIGISTGSVNTTPGESQSPTNLVLDETKFLDALAKNPSEVKKLMIGDGTTTKGVLSNLLSLADNALDPEFGVFAARNKSASDQIAALDATIKKSEDRLVVKEKQLRTQFMAMERLISQFQQQQQSISKLG